jgi:uncharacterized protein YcbK (DUF882 family)
MGLAGVPEGRKRTQAGRKLALVAGVALYAFARAPQSTEPALADGETRTLTFVNHHTNESGSFTFRRYGAYDQAELDKLNWFMRDWRLNEQIKMDPRLFDILWEVYRGGGSAEPIDVLSGYRSPQTNALLRRRSRQVAEHSQHMQGKAIDAHFQDIATAAIRDVAMRAQGGGVGFYPIGSTPWVHVDSGAVRYWPRMSRNALARLFPDGKTVFIPADGQPMAGYEEAKAMIEARGAEVQTASAGGGLFGFLFGGARGGGADDDEESGGAGMIASGRGGPPPQVAVGRGSFTAPVAYAAAPPPPPPLAAPLAAPFAPAHAAATAPVLAPVPVPAPVLARAPLAPEPEVAAVAAPADAAGSAIDEEPAAPLPPHRPADLFARIDAPSPPRRPNDLELAQANKGDSNVIASLIERDALPGAIVKGLHKPPESALSLTETRPAQARPSTSPSPDALARAASLSAPLPPPRPRDATPEGVSAVEKTPPTPPPRPNRNLRPSASNPFGSLVIDAFAAPVTAPSSAPPVPASPAP